MKAKLILLLSIVLLSSCNGTKEKKLSKEEKIQKSISKKVKSVLKNPDSFKFVSMKIKKTITVGERKKTMTKEYLEKVKGLSDDLYNQAKTELEFLDKQTDPNKEAVYYVDFEAMGTNSFGALIKNKFSATVLNDENYTVVHLK